MATDLLFVQGAGAGTHDQWDNKLVDSLDRALGSAFGIRYPRMPNEDAARYAEWKAALLDEFASLRDGAILVGHSLGGTVLLHLLAEERPALKPGALILLAAPFIGEGGWPSDEIQARTDFVERLPAGLPVLLYHGTADPIVPFHHAALYAKTLPQAVLRALAGRDHQLDNDLSDVARDIRSSRLRRG